MTSFETNLSAAKTLFMDALALQEAGEFERAEGKLREALAFAPDRESILVNLSGMLVEQKKFKDARPFCMRVVALNPENIEAWLNLGLCDVAEDLFENAVTCFRHVLACAADHLIAHKLLSRMLCALARYDEALMYVERAIALEPRNAESQRLKSLVLVRLERFEEALATYKLSLELEPEQAEAWLETGNLLTDMGRANEALSFYEQAIRLLPNDGQVDHNLGNAQARCGRFEEAIASYNRALSLHPDGWLSVCNRALSRLSLRDYRAGFADYEARWQADLLPPHDVDGVMWQGEDIVGKRLFVHAEQGFGDMIQYARFVTEAAGRGAQVQLGLPATLLPLMRSLKGVETAFKSRGEIPAYDFHCSIISLPHVLGIELCNLPNAVPYLQAPDEYKDKWKQRCKDLPRPRIGLMWARNETGTHPVRSMPLKTLHPLADIDACFVSLQKEYEAYDRTEMADTPWLRDYSNSLDDFADTAALIEQMDLVVSVDTSVAHLSGALGKSLWILLPHVPDWRWLAGEGEDCPWYPTARLFRQSDHGDWEGLVQRILPLLRAKVSEMQTVL